MRRVILLLLACLFFGGNVYCSEYVVESRSHSDFKSATLKKPLPDEVREAIASSTGTTPEATFIDREWYRERPVREEATAEITDAMREEIVALFDTKVDGIRFAWTFAHDFETGTMEGALTIWKGSLRKDRFEFKLESNPAGKNLKEFAGTPSSQQPPDEEVLFHLTYGGREWVMPLSDWRSGRLLPEDLELLRASIDDTLRGILEVVQSAALMDVDMRMACALVTAPLLEDYANRCKPQSLQVNTRAKSLDCDFDQWFGYPCTDEQLQRFWMTEKGPQDLAGD